LRSKTWKIGAPIPGGNECQVVELDDGTLLLNMRNYLKRGQRLLSTSPDRGATWTQPISDPDLIGQQIIDAMGVRELAAEDVLRVVIEAVRDRAVLFILDKFGGAGYLLKELDIKNAPAALRKAA